MWRYICMRGFVLPNRCSYLACTVAGSKEMRHAIRNGTFSPAARPFAALLGTTRLIVDITRR